MSGDFPTIKFTRRSALLLGAAAVLTAKANAAAFQGAWYKVPATITQVLKGALSGGGYLMDYNVSPDGTTRLITYDTYGTFYLGRGTTGYTWGHL
jgi:hypothetical protein